MLLVIKGADTSRVGYPVPVHAPIDKAAKIITALICEAPPAGFELWQDVTWYFYVDAVKSSISQTPGANLLGAKVLLEVRLS